MHGWELYRMYVADVGFPTQSLSLLRYKYRIFPFSDILNQIEEHATPSSSNERARILLVIVKSDSSVKHAAILYEAATSKLKRTSSFLFNLSKDVPEKIGVVSWSVECRRM